MSTNRCPKKDPQLKKMMQDGTFMCYLSHAIVLRCSDSACCEDCEKLSSCPNACPSVETKKTTKGYIT